MVWAGILMNGATNICLINGSVDSKVYQEIILSHFKPFVDKYLRTWRIFLQQDNAPCHTSLSTRTFFEQNGIRVFPTPPESPDLNPIENLWHKLKHFLTTSVKPRNKEDLIFGGISAFWETVTPEKCQRYIGHLIKKSNSQLPGH
jgi:transposase